MKKFLVIAGVLMVASVAAAGDHSYVGAAKCKMCHKVQYKSWLETKHAKATEDAKKGAEDRKFEPSCLKCHSTSGDESLPGVQCEACHGPGSDYKKMSVMKDLDKAMDAGLIIALQDQCNKCHTGDDHSKTVKFEEQINNKQAIHEFKKDPKEYIEKAKAKKK